MMPQENIGSAVTNALPARIPWSGLMGNYDFYHGCPLEHPQRMGEDHR